MLSYKGLLYLQADDEFVAARLSRRSVSVFPERVYVLNVWSGVRRFVWPSDIINARALFRSRFWERSYNVTDFGHGLLLVPAGFVNSLEYSGCYLSSVRV